MTSRTEALVELIDLLGRQADAIDSGDGAAWAEAFLPEGTFASPTYAAPVQGREALAEFARRFPLNSPSTHHLYVNIHLAEFHQDRALLRARLMIVAEDGEPRILRVVTSEDNCVHTPNGWRIAHRRITRGKTA